MFEISVLSVFFLHAHMVQPARKAMSRLPIKFKYIVLISLAFVLCEVFLSRE